MGFHDYHAFGPEVTGSDERPLTALKFTGHERDIQSSFLGTLDYMHARFYSPGMGRFLSVDPGKDWNAAAPQSWNLFTYVRSNPINAMDPNGELMISGRITVTARDPALEQARLWVFARSFLKGVSGYNYGKGAYTYLRGIGRATVHRSRRDGDYGEKDKAAAEAEDRNVKKLEELLIKCVRNTTCRGQLKDALVAANARLQPHERMDMTQVAAGRLVTGGVISYLFTKAGFFPVGPTLALTAAIGDSRHYMEQANPTLESLIGLAEAIVTGGR